MILSHQWTLSSAHQETCLQATLLHSLISIRPSQRAEVTWFATNAHESWSVNTASRRETRRQILPIFYNFCYNSTKVPNDSMLRAVLCRKSSAFKSIGRRKIPKIVVTIQTGMGLNPRPRTSQRRKNKRKRVRCLSTGFWIWMSTVVLSHSILNAMTFKWPEPLRSRNLPPWGSVFAKWLNFGRTYPKKAVV